MKKSKLDVQEINNWMRGHWIVYSTQMYNGKLLRLLVGGQGKYRIMHGEETLYEGFQMTHAIAAWDKA